MDTLRLGICCSLRHAWFASELTARLERNLGIATLIIADDTAMAAETWEQASASSAVLILLDSTNARGPVQREVWRSLLEHNGEPPVAVVRMEACQYPKLLERSRFHIMTDPVAAARWVERWLVHVLLPVAPASAFSIAGLSKKPDYDMAAWWTQMVDRPGAVDAPDLDAAQAFAHEAAAHFDGVCWMASDYTPRPVLTAEIQYKAERGRRLLFVLAGTGGEVAAGLKPSRHSFVIVPPSPTEAVPMDHPAAAWLGALPQSGFHRTLPERVGAVDWEHLAIRLSADGSWMRPAARFQSTETARAGCVNALEQIFAFRRRWSGLCRDLASHCGTALRGSFSGELCLDLALFLIDEGRRAEGVAWLRILERQTSDEALRSQASHELSWLVDDVGAVRPFVALPGDQLDFGFAGFERPEAGERSEEEALLAEISAHEANSRQRGPTRIKQLHLPLIETNVVASPYSLFDQEDQ